LGEDEQVADRYFPLKLWTNNEEYRDLLFNFEIYCLIFMTKIKQINFFTRIYRFVAKKKDAIIQLNL
jgi:hypothetical protein